MNVWKQKDIKLFLIVIPVINLINYFITYNNVSFNFYFFITFLIDTAQGYFAWLIIRYIIIKMEMKSPLIHFSFERILKQLILTSVIGLAIIILLTEILNAAARDTPVPLSFYFLDIWIYFIWILVINGVYIGMYYFLIWRNSEQKLIGSQNLKAEGINVKIGNKNSKIALNSIAGFYVEDNVSFVIDQNSKSYIIESSLENLEYKLPPEIFFRINRKYILNRSSIVSFKRIENNKLLILTIDNNVIPAELTLSRLKSPAFKKWFEKDMLEL